MASADRDAEFGSRDARPCSPGCRQPVSVILAWRSLSFGALLVRASLRLHPAASTSTTAPIQSVRVFMGLHSLRSSLTRAKAVQATVRSGDHSDPTEHAVPEVDVHGADDEVGATLAEANDLDPIL